MSSDCMQSCFEHPAARQAHYMNHDALVCTLLYASYFVQACRLANVCHKDLKPTT